MVTYNTVGGTNKLLFLQKVFEGYSYFCGNIYPKAVVLNRGGAPPQGGVKKFLGGNDPLHALQHGKLLNGNASLSNVTPELILRRYMLFGLVPAVMEVGVKYLEILQADFESACKHSGAQLVGMPSPFNNNTCAIVAFDRAPRSV